MELADIPYLGCGYYGFESHGGQFIESFYNLVFLYKINKKGYYYLFYIFKNNFFMMTNNFFLGMTVAAKSIGAGLATIGVVGAGTGIGIVFAGLLIAIARIQVKKRV